jgi:hypothetical protein
MSLLEGIVTEQAAAVLVVTQDESIFHRFDRLIGRATAALRARKSRRAPPLPHRRPGKAVRRVRTDH